MDTITELNQKEINIISGTGISESLLGWALEYPQISAFAISLSVTACLLCCVVVMATHHTKNTNSSFKSA